MRKLFIIFLFFVQNTFAQNITAFSDYQKYFWIFDSGKYRQMEYQPVLSYQVGDKCIAYVTNANHLKVYYNHIDYDVSSMVSNYQVTDNLVSYTIGTQLYVFENGVKKNLAHFVGHQCTGDSIVGFYDTEKYLLQAYYKGNIITLADGIVSGETSQFVAGSNLLTFKDNYQNVLVFYQNKIYEIIRTDLPVVVKMGRNIMGFIDPDTDFLKAFYKGETIELEAFKPKSFQVGYEKLAYVDNMESFKLFDNGETFTICDFKPQLYTLKDNMLVYHQQGQLWAFVDGQSYLVQNYIPASYQISDNAIVYLDQSGFLNIFEHGNNKVLTYEKVNDYEVLRNVVMYNEGMNTTCIYYEGSTYKK